MPESPRPQLARIAVFYDGNFLHHVGNYYKYFHTRRARLALPGLHDFIRRQVSRDEGLPLKLCRVTEAHYFRSRHLAKDSDSQQRLAADRVLDDTLMAEGVTTHYLPIRGRSDGGVDLWLALEAYEQTFLKRFDVVVLVAGDAGFVPLVRKLQTLGTQVMVLGWELRYEELGVPRETVTSSALLQECCRPILMHEVIDDRAHRDEPWLRDLFVEAKPLAPRAVSPPAHPSAPAEDAAPPPAAADEKRLQGEVCSLRDGFGFIRCVEFPNNIFFYWNELRNKDFNELQVGERVTFVEGKNDKGPIAVRVDVVS